MKPRYPFLRPMFLVAIVVAGANSAAARLIATDVASDVLIQVDPATGAVTTIGPLGDPVVASLAFDSRNQILYATSTSTNALLTVNPQTGATAAVGSLGVRLMHAMEYDSNNDALYGISNDTGFLYTIDRLTGNATTVGSTGIGSVGGMAFDATRNVMYASDAVNSTGLFTIDLATGASSLVGPFNNAAVVNIAGLAFHPRYGLFGSDQKLSSAVDDELFHIDATSGQATFIGGLNSGNTLGLTFIVAEPAAATLLVVALASAALCAGVRLTAYADRFDPFRSIS